jgi:hypothetical protein
MVFMRQAPAVFKEFGGNRDLLLRALGLSASDLHPALPMKYGSTGRWTLLVPVLGLDVMRRMQARPDQFATALSDMPDASVHPFCLEASSHEVHLHARHFSAPSSGTLEDPVTGTASGVLGAYYRAFMDPAWNGAAPLVVEQGLEMGREGRVSVWVTKPAIGTMCGLPVRRVSLRKERSCFRPMYGSRRNERRASRGDRRSRRCGRLPGSATMAPAHGIRVRTCLMGRAHHRRFDGGGHVIAPGLRGYGRSASASKFDLRVVIVPTHAGRDCVRTPISEDATVKAKCLN